MSSRTFPGGTGARGVSVLEAVVSLLLGLLLTALVLSVLARQRALVAALGTRAEALAAVRTVRVVLRREARAMGVGTWASSADSVGLRAYRGTATVCPTRASGPVLRVAPAGVRSVDPTKDSVMAVTSGGDVLFRALVDSEGGGVGCGVGSSQRWERWTLSEPVPGGIVLVRYFERGSYHLSGGAFRYRRGAAGRQPLTPQTLRTPESRFLPSAAGLHALVFLEGAQAVPAVDLFLGGGAP